METLERCVTLLQVEPDGTVHLLHSFFNVVVGLFSTARQLFPCHGELLREGLPPVVELPVHDFSVRISVHTLARVDHVSHLEGPLHLSGKLCHTRW